MKCKFCFAEVEDDVTVCPVCGKALEEVEKTEENFEAKSEEEFNGKKPEKAKKKMPKALAVILAVFGALVLAAVLAVAVLYGMGIKLDSIFGNEGGYTVSDKKLEKKADKVIAQIGDQTLTNEQLQVYYWVTVQDYVYQYEYAISMGADTELGFDLKKPLSEQIYDPKSGQTYEEFFLENALESWRRYASFVQLSQDGDFVLGKDIQEFLDGYKDDLEAAAKENGHANAEAYVDAEISKGSSVDAYYHYISTQYTALGYLQSKEPEMASTEKELEDYYKAHEKELTAEGYGKDAGKYYDVRHIFVTVQGEMGKTGYTDAQWQDCLNKAQRLLDDFLANEPTEQKFAELASKNSEDPGSAANGGLYANLTKNYGFIKEFEDWYTDESRKPGDTGIVKNTGSTKVGYHVMYFSASREIWKDQVETLILSEKMGELLEQTKKTYPMTVNYKKIVLGEADLAPETK